MDGDLLTARDAARRMGISVTTFYDWLGQSDYGLLLIRGQPVAIRYFQTGPGGKGKIMIEPDEVERIREFMCVPQRSAPSCRPPIRRDSYPGITVQLGRPNA